MLLVLCWVIAHFRFESPCTRVLLGSRYVCWVFGIGLLELQEVLLRHPVCKTLGYSTVFMLVTPRGHGIRVHPLFTIQACIYIATIRAFKNHLHGLVIIRVQGVVLFQTNRVLPFFKIIRARFRYHTYKEYTCHFSFQMQNFDGVMWPRVWEWRYVTDALTKAEWLRLLKMSTKGLCWVS